MKQTEDKRCSMTISFLTDDGKDKVEVILEISFTVKAVEETKEDIVYGEEK